MAKLKRKNLTTVKKSYALKKPKEQPGHHKGPWHVRQVNTDRDGIPPKSKPQGRKLSKKKRKKFLRPKNEGQGTIGDNSTGSGVGTSHPVQK
jgi:hypothetical protein